MKFKSNVKNFFYGLCLGISLLPPGFSVATMAMLMGIYEALINLLNDLFSTSFIHTLRILLFLGLGAVTGIALFSNIISFSIDTFPIQTNFFFIGLIVATIPLITKQMDYKKNFRLKEAIFLIISFIVVGSFIFVNTENTIIVDNISIWTLLYLMLAGSLVAASMILPGLSGALILVLLGIYQFLLDNLSSMNLIVITSVVFGAVLGLVLFGRLLKFLLSIYESFLYSMSLGLIFGSIPVILAESIPYTLFDIVTSIIIFITGFLIVTLLNKKPQTRKK